MKHQRILLLCALLLCLVLPALAQDMRTEVGGSWVSSSGTPIELTPGDDPQLTYLSINGGPKIECWLSGGRDGNVYLTYTAPDGTPMSGKHDAANQTIAITSENGFKATWKRP